MDQISRPLLIALIAVAGFAGAWMTVLRPKAADESAAAQPAPAVTQPAPAPAQTGLGRAVDKAKGAVAASTASAQASEAAAGQAQAPAKPAVTTAAPQPAPVVTKQPEPAPVPKVDTRPTILLFAGAGADDAVARDVVRSFRGPDVHVIVARIGDVAKYRELLGSVQVAASPTILVYGADHQAQMIQGLPDVAQVQQALRAVR
ncbi:MAG: hypothetical protein ACJ762_19870 [Solirubrobacteraceae bacterium]